MELRNGLSLLKYWVRKFRTQDATANSAGRGNAGHSDISNFRWHNHLDPMVRKSPWNESEEFVFIEAHKLHGNKWAEIAKMIPGR